MTSRDSPPSPASASRGKRRGLHIALISVAGLLALVIGGLGIVAATFDPNVLKPRIQDAVRQATGRDLSLNGDIGIKLSLWPTVAARDVTFANPPGFSRPHMATLHGLELRLALLPLLSSRVEIERLVLIGPDIRLETDAQGRPNWAISGKPAERPTLAPTQPAAPRPSTDLLASVGMLRIEAGSLSWQDAPSGQHRALRIETLEVTSGSADAPLRMDGSLVVDTVPLTVNAQTGSIAHLTGGDTATPFPVTLTLKSGGVSVDAQGEIRDPLGARVFDATLKATIPDSAVVAPLFPGVSIPAAQNIAFGARVRGQGATLTSIDRISVKTGPVILPDQARGARIERLEIVAPSQDEPVNLSIAARLDTLPVSLTGTIGHPGLDLATIRPVPVDLRLTVADSALAVKGRIEKPAILSGVSLDIAATIPDLAALALLAGQPLPPVNSIALQAKIADNDGGIARGVSVRNLRLSLPGADLAGDGTATWSGKPAIDATLRSDRLDMDGVIAMLARVDAPHSTPPPPSSGATPQPSGARTNLLIPDTPLPVAGLRQVDADVRLRIGTLRWAKADYNDLDAHAVLRDGQLRVAPFAATTPEGRVTGTFSVEAGGAPARVHLTAQAPSLSAAAILAAAGGRPTVSGPLEVRADLTGTGDTVRAIVGSLTGSLGLAMAGGTIDTRVLSGSIGALTKDLAILDLLGRGGGLADIRCIAIRLDARDGVARSRALLLSSSLLTADGGGTIDLRNETLNLMIRPQGRVGGSGFRVPIKVIGTLRAPRFEIDATGAAETNVDKLAGIIIGGGNPQAGAALGVLGGLLGSDRLQSEGGSPCPAALALARGAAHADSGTTHTAPAQPPSPTSQPAPSPRREPPALPNADRLLRQLFR